ncbi:MAG: Rrf2 family transcriptional regulator [Gemmataceae bacterium]
MMPYGKTAQHAIAAMSRLAEVYATGARTSSREIAEIRGLPQPIVAKVLTILSQAGLIVGAPGPGGGYALTRPPDTITLLDVAELFDRQEQAIGCPYGPRHCGNGPPCPLHERTVVLRGQIRAFLESTTFALFVGRGPGISPSAEVPPVPLPPGVPPSGCEWDA